MIGKSISHYKILSKLGEGGMGVVYKAHDTKLNREVALKFLPPHISTGGVDRERFLQEAQAAAALNHPNICVIYDIKEESEQPFIVMEYVDGGTIRTKLESGPMRIDDAMRYGIQIGEALQEAHSKGIVHRDIKADNIMINSKGQVKVMDFGLAKLKGSLKLTKTSSTIGTLAYMAPEQIQGGEVDTRSDIFAFAVLLFEMLTARLPFRGEHEAAMLYSIVNEDPEPIQKYLPEISPELIHTLSKALEKDPNDRYQSIQDMVVDLRRSKKDSTRVSRATQTIHRTESAPEQPLREKESGFALNKKTIGFVSVSIVLALIAYFTMFSSRVHINPDLKFRKLQIPFSQVSYPSLSADGKWTAFAAADINGKWDVYYMHTGEGEPKRVTYDSSIFVEQNSDISPDGSKIAYNYFNLSKQRLEVIVVSVLGGTGKLVALNSLLQRWRPDGTRIGYMQFRNPKNASISLWSVNADGSDNRLEFADSLSVPSRISFCWSPDGNSIAWIRSMKGSYQEVIVKNLVNGKEKEITDDKSNIDDVCWLQNDMILYSSNKNGNSNLWMVSKDGGESQQVTTGTSTDLGIRASSDGKTILYYQQQKIGKIWIGDLKSRTSKQITFDDLQIDDVSLPPNGSQMAYIASVAEGDISSGNELFVTNRNGSNRQQLTNGKHTLRRVLWSPDGKYIGYIEHKFNNAPDSSDVIILESSNTNTPLHVVHGVSSFQWVDAKTIRVRFPNATQNSLYDLETRTTSLFYEDSTSAVPVNSKRMVLYYESRQGKQGFYIRSSGYKTNPEKFPPKQFIPDQTYKSVTFLDIQDQFFYWKDRNNKFFRKNYVTGVIENLSGNYPSYEINTPGNVSPNNKEFAYVARQANGKFILIENLFK